MPGPMPRAMPGAMPCRAPAALLLLTAPLLAGCSLVTGVAVNSLAEVLAEGEAVYRSDEDLELVGSALAFNLKTLETLLLANPEHDGMLLSAAKGFLLYAYGFVEPQRFDLDFTQFEEEQAIRARAARLYARAADFGMRGLELRHPGIRERLRRAPESAAAELDTEDAALALWTGTALGGRIGMATDDPEATADLSVVGALLDASRRLDDTVDDGVVYDYLSVYEVARVGGSMERAREHYERSLAVGAERLPVVWSTWAETGSVANGDHEEFDALLRRTLDFDLDSEPGGRLLNRIAQERAAWLLRNREDYFLDILPAEGGSSTAEGGPSTAEGRSSTAEDPSAAAPARTPAAPGLPPLP